MRSTGLLLAFLAAGVSITLATQLGAQLADYDWHSYTQMMQLSQQSVSSEIAENMSSSIPSSCERISGGFGAAPYCGGDCSEEGADLTCQTDPRDGQCGCFPPAGAPCGRIAGFGIQPYCGGDCSEEGADLTCQTDPMGGDCACLPPSSSSESSSSSPESSSSSSTVSSSSSSSIATTSSSLSMMTSSSSSSSVSSCSWWNFWC